MLAGHGTSRFTGMAAKGLRSARWVVLFGIATVLVGCGAGGTPAVAPGTETTPTTAQEQGPLTAAEKDFVQLATKAYKSLSESEAKMILALSKRPWTAKQDAAAQKIWTIEKSEIELWDGYQAPSERLQAAVEAWFAVLKSEQVGLKKYVAAVNNPESQAKVNALVDQYGKTGRLWKAFQSEVDKL